MARRRLLFLVVFFLPLMTAQMSVAACSVTHNFVAGNTAVADDVDTNFNDLKTCVETLQDRDTIAEHETVDAVNVLLETEIDASSELRALLDDESGTGALIFADGAIGAATATTATADDNDTSVATTAYVQTELNAAGGTDLTCASGSCDVDSTVARTANLSAYTVGTSAPTDGSTSCTEGDMYLDHTANKIYFCVDSATDDWFGVAITDTP